MELPPPRVEQECRRNGFGNCMNSHMYDWLGELLDEEQSRNSFLREAEPSSTSKQNLVNRRKRLVQSLEGVKIPDENLVVRMTVDGFRDEGPVFDKIRNFQSGNQQNYLVPDE